TSGSCRSDPQPRTKEEFIMAVTLANQQENYRAVYVEATGDGASTSFVITHAKFRKPNHSVKATGVTAPSSLYTHSSGGGLRVPLGTSVAIASTVLDAVKGTITITTSAAIANATTAYF